jgi:hypothetical protein
MYVKPTITLLRVETEGVIAGAGSGLRTTMDASTDWGTTVQDLGKGPTSGDTDRGDVYIHWPSTN